MNCMTSGFPSSEVLIFCDIKSTEKVFSTNSAPSPTLGPSCSGGVRECVEKSPEMEAGLKRRWVWGGKWCPNHLTEHSEDMGGRGGLHRTGS